MVISIPMLCVINNCSLDIREKGSSDNPPQTKMKPPNALYAKYSISFFWGGHSQNDLTTIKKYFTPISLLSSISLLWEPNPLTESLKTRFIFTLGFLHPVSIFQTWIVFHVFLKATYGKASCFVWSFKTVFNLVKHQARVTITFSHFINCGVNGRIDVTTISHACCNMRCWFSLKISELNSF